MSEGTGTEEELPRRLNETLQRNSERFIRYVNKKIIQEKVRLLHSMDE